jgi:hypothetical protein
MGLPFIFARCPTPLLLLDSADNGLCAGVDANVLKVTFTVIHGYVPHGAS